jgi:hypothetical protein
MHENSWHICVYELQMHCSAPILTPEYDCNLSLNIYSFLIMNASAPYALVGLLSRRLSCRGCLLSIIQRSFGGVEEPFCCTAAAARALTQREHEDAATSQTHALPQTNPCLIA